MTLTNFKHKGAIVLHKSKQDCHS